MARLTATGVALGILLAAAGLFVGLGAFTFQYAEGHSYLSDDPATCVNCHVMNDQYDRWQRSSHREWAVCNDCHTPTGFVAKWATKAINGWNHSVRFTLDDFDEPIMVKGWNRRIALERCVDCHADMLDQVLGGPHQGARDAPVEELRCVECHGNVGHPGPERGAPGLRPVAGSGAVQGSGAAARGTR